MGKLAGAGAAAHLAPATEVAMSALSEPAGHGMTVAEFLEHDDGTQTRYELVDGELVATNPPATRHVRICQNIGRALDRQLRSP